MPSRQYEGRYRTDTGIYELKNYANGLFVLAGIQLLILFGILWPSMKIFMTTFVKGTKR